MFADDATKVPNNAFNDCEKLTTVTLSDTITTIGYRAFYNCTSLESIDIPDSVTYIDDYAFYNCSNLTTVTTPANDCYIDYMAFYDCTKLTTVNYNIYSGTVYYNAFNNCPVTTLNIGPGVSDLPEFKSVENITFGTTENGLNGTCNADKLVFITTRGGIYASSHLEMGSKYIECMCEFFGIENYKCICAEGVDIFGLDTEKIINDAMAEAEKEAVNF